MKRKKRKIIKHSYVIMALQNTMQCTTLHYTIPQCTALQHCFINNLLVFMYIRVYTCLRVRVDSLQQRVKH